MNVKLKIRAAQLDLARQIETIDFIKEYIDFIAGNGYNSLHINLEGIIRTKSFPYPEDGKCYTPEEMKEIVDYAAIKGIDVIPLVPVFGHAELFLKYQEMEELSELRGNRRGRISNHINNCFCLSKKETHIFLERYLTEICEIFPSKYFNMGGDETWDIGYCEICAPKAKEFKGEQQLFLNHIKRCHTILSKKLNKTVIMWDDMFEFYDDILTEIPNDIIMACWQYQDDVRYVLGHFACLKVENRLDEYERLGIKYIFAGSDWCASNVSSFTKYACANGRKPLGGLLTSFDKGKCFVYKAFPTIAYAGRLWNNDGGFNEKRIFKELTWPLFGTDDESLVNAIHFFYKLRECMSKESTITLNSLITVVFSGRKYEHFESMRFLHSVLLTRSSVIQTELGKIVYQDMLDACEYYMLNFRMHKIIIDLIEFSEEECITKELKALKKDMESLRNRRLNMWKQCRNGIDSSDFERHFNANLQLLDSIPAKIKTHGIMRVRFFLPNQYSLQECKIMLKYDNEWQEIANGVFKGDLKQSFYEVMFFIEKDKEPEMIRVESKGSGGQGIAYIEVKNDLGRFIPVSVVSATGKVIDPEHVLDNDFKWSFLGEKNAMNIFLDRASAEEVHSVEFELGKLL